MKEVIDTGLFDRIFGRKPRQEQNAGYWYGLSGYTPVFTDWGGELYESELVRAAVHARATHISKLKAEGTGTAKPSFTRQLLRHPNAWQTWGQFLYRTSTILDMQNTAFIVPVQDDYLETSGIYCVLPSRCEIVDVEGEPWLRYRFSNGKCAAVEMRRCGILTKFQYQNDIFGADNKALTPTMQLINVQNQGIQEGVKSSATFRFSARMNNFMSPEDLDKERKRFNRNNLQDGEGGLLLFPNTYSDVKQIDAKPYVADADQMKLIRQNVFEYFGINEEVLQNKAYGDAWNAFYEGAIEPFAIQFSDVISRMLYSSAELTRGAGVMLTSNRLQYASNTEKHAISTDLVDRGMITIDEGREIWNLPPLPDGRGDRYIVRGEYYDTTDKFEGEGGEGNAGEE